jgi:hypothetical protein
MTANTPSVPERGIHLLRDPQLNKSTAFTEAEREAKGLEAFLESQLYKPDYQKPVATGAGAGRA